MSFPTRFTALAVPSFARSTRRFLTVGASLLLVSVSMFASNGAAAQHKFPQVEIPAELPDHPRLFWNNKEIAEFKAWMGREPWLKQYIDELKTTAEKTVDNPTLPSRNQSQNVTIGQQAHKYAILHVLTGEKRFAEGAAKILRAYVEVFPSYPIANMKGKATGSTLGECDWVINAASAYDLIYNSGVLTDKDKQAIEQEVFKVSGEVMRICNHRFRSNWRGRAIAGVATVGFCINDQDLINEAVNGYRDENGRVARDGFVQHVAWSILADGVFYERSMHYHMYTAEAYTLIAEAARHSGIDLWNMEIPGHPLDAGADMQRKFGETGPKTVKAIFDSPFYEAFSDGSLVRLGNSYTDQLERTRCYERAYAAYRDPKFAWILRRKVKFYRPIAGGGYIDDDDETAAKPSMPTVDSSSESRRPFNPIELLWLTPDLPKGHFDHTADATIGVTGRHENFCTLLPNGGITTLRQSADAAAVGVQMTYGDWGSAHTHPELLAMTVSAHGQQIVPEVRYHHYGHADFLTWDRQTIAHNTVTVDQKSQYPQGDGDDVWVVERNGKQAHGYPVMFHAGDQLKAFRAKCDAVNDGVMLDRTIVLLDSVVVDFYRCRSEEEHQYDFALHIDGLLEQSSVAFSEPTTGPVSKSLGYMHMTRVSRAQAASGATDLTYAGNGDGPRMRLQLLSSGKTELISAQGHVDLKGKPKDVLILRKQGANADFVDVLSFSPGKKVTARRLEDVPRGVLGVELTATNGDVQIVLSAEKAGAYTYADQTFTGQLALLKRSKDGATRVVTVVP